MRVRFPPGEQRVFVQRVQQMTQMNIEQLAHKLGRCTRTIRDWRREQWQMDEKSLDSLCHLAELPRPKNMLLLQEHWSVKQASRIGGRRYSELYGSPGSPDGRTLGGRNAQERFRCDPERFRRLGVSVRKRIAVPALSADLAEWIGIALGDGSIKTYQVTISFNATLDALYAEYVADLGARLFSVAPGQVIDKHGNELSLVWSSVELVEALEHFGLKRGNKIRHQIDIPAWVWERNDYQLACLRGLMDTDGCVYRHRYAVNHKVYSYCKLCFTSYSLPLLHSTKRLFENLGLFPTIHQHDRRRLYLHDSRAVKRYFEQVGTHNPRYQERFEQFVRQAASSHPIDV